MDVQKRIKKLMSERGWTEYKLAKETHLSQSTIANIFRRNNAPTIPTIEAICKTFGITMAQFFADEGEQVVLTDEQKQLLILWGTLSKKQKNLLYELLQTM